MSILTPGYCIEFDSIRKSDWSELLQQFGDATIYHTWSYGTVRWGENHLSHLVLKRENEIVGMAQVIIKKLPIFRPGIAYIPWGPLWRNRNRDNNHEDFVNILRAVRNEYAVRRKLFLRIRPNVALTPNGIEPHVLQSESFVLSSSVASYHTLIVDLKPPLDELRRRLNPKWRNKLNGAEKNGLQVIKGETDDFYQAFLTLQKEMLARKEYDPGVDYEEFREIQTDLPKNLKMHIFLCKHEDDIVSSVICSAIGNTGIYLLGATGNKGLTLKGSYLLQWRAIEWLKQNGYRWYDLGGINPETNPGVYQFKAGLSGNDVHHIGQFEFCTNPTSAFVVSLGYRFRAMMRKMKI
jgi:lipid II:glycine glycyltransferase (peptidoglycan interpeptide bridge formation enzyme)